MGNKDLMRYVRGSDVMQLGVLFWFLYICLLL